MMCTDVAGIPRRIRARRVTGVCTTAAVAAGRARKRPLTCLRQAMRRPQLRTVSWSENRPSVGLAPSGAV
jgi:hypothetical protein